MIFSYSYSIKSLIKIYQTTKQMIVFFIVFKVFFEVIRVNKSLIILTKKINPLLSTKQSPNYDTVRVCYDIKTLFKPACRRLIDYHY